MTFEFTPIGAYRSSVVKNKIQAPRQAGLDSNKADQTSNTSQTNNITNYILLEPKYRAGLKDLEGFSYIWVLYVFHKNENTKFKPLVLPPRVPSKKGVFATRSPYRPNPIGMSVLKLKTVDLEKGRLMLESSSTDSIDLLNRTPILDIKPYVPQYDSKSGSTGWLENLEQSAFQVRFTNLVLEQIQFLISQDRSSEKYYVSLQSLIERQLTYDPINSNKKRVKKYSDNIFIFSYRTWRIFFEFNSTSKDILVLKILSCYQLKNNTSTPTSLLTDEDDLHAIYHLQFP